ncbi:phosphate regulon transcriptional regulator PhoB [Pelagibacteraceae bacterium]|nr:phosphate regulon transcriptional regulator PhoB [Pelagibacteraceae bacterium]|tara:strand:- start:243 stop:929 length:687 start_codon:yes stop_codon:yes gene_type:complete
MKAKILVVEDELSIVELLKYNLSKAGYDVDYCLNGESALDKIFSTTKYDLILIDWMLPELSGIEISRRIRKNKSTKNVPLIMLTARGEEEDKLRGFESEVDDYITKPFSINELLARVKAVLKRMRPIFYNEILTYKGIQLDSSTHKVSRNHLEINLGPTEFNLLRFLMENQGKVFSRQQLLDYVWTTSPYVEPRTVDVHIRRLRKALNEGFDFDPIRTVRSAGYSLGL